MSADIKRALFQKCLDYVDKRIVIARSSMDAAQSAANDESKSSAGDKYETGRAMMQIQRDQFASQLSEALKLKQVMDQIKPDSSSQGIVLGSLVFTDKGNYYISVSVGKLEVDSIEYFAISPVSPIGKELMNKKAGEKIAFNGKESVILNVF
ncbi:MAG: 3-oxoacyl-ACP synthase [Cytophagaceae bacterium]